MGAISYRNADYPVRPAVDFETYDHARLRRARYDAHDNVVELEPQPGFLCADLFRKPDVAEPTELVHRCAGRNSVRFATGVPNRLDRVLPALANPDVETVLDNPAVGPHQSGHQDIADAVIHRIFVWHPAFLNDDAFHSNLGRGCGDETRVVRLHSADGDQRIGTGCNCVRHDVLELSEFVTAHCETGVAVFSLGVDFYLAPEMRRQSFELLNRRGTEGERISWKTIE